MGSLGQSQLYADYQNFEMSLAVGIGKLRTSFLEVFATNIYYRKGGNY
jgi:hypothetical protein